MVPLTERECLPPGPGYRREVSALWFAIPSGLGVLLWLATDQFILLILGALMGLALGLGANANRGGR